MAIPKKGIKNLFNKVVLGTIIVTSLLTATGSAYAQDAPNLKDKAKMSDVMNGEPGIDGPDVDDGVIGEEVSYSPADNDFTAVDLDDETIDGVDKLLSPVLTDAELNSMDIYGQEGDDLLVVVYDEITKEPIQEFRVNIENEKAEAIKLLAERNADAEAKIQKAPTPGA